MRGRGDIPPSTVRKHTEVGQRDRDWHRDRKRNNRESDRLRELIMGPIPT